MIYRLKNTASFVVDVFADEVDGMIATFNAETLAGARALAAFTAGALSRGDFVVDNDGECLRGQPDA